MVKVNGYDSLCSECKLASLWFVLIGLIGKPWVH